MGEPAFISIEPTNHCNLQCPECPTGNKSSIIPKGKISLDLCKQIVPQIKDTVLFANLYFQGEPFLNENIIPIIRLCHNARILTSISTNAHFIPTETAEKLVETGLTKIIISLDGYNQETYEKYRRNGQFNKVLEGMLAIKKAKEKFQSKLPLIELQCLLFSHTENHKKEIYTIGKNYGADIVQFKTAQFYSTENIELLPSDKNSRYKLAKENLQLKHNSKNKCWRMWNSCIIAWNGDVLPCCFDKNHQFSFGNLYKSEIKNIWYSPEYNNFRNLILKNRRNIKMCQNCIS